MLYTGIGCRGGFALRRNGRSRWGVGMARAPISPEFQEQPAETRPTERLKFARPPDLPGVEILRGERCTRLFTVFHETYDVSAVYAAPGDWRYRHRDYVQRPGQLSLMEPGEVHRNVRTHGPTTFRVLFMPPSLVTEMAAERGLPASVPRLASPQMADAELFRAFHALHEALEGASTALERQSRLTACLNLYLERCMERHPAPLQVAAGHAGVRRAVDFLHAHISSNCSLEELSRVARLSRFHLLRSFSRDCGVPPHEYQIQLRIAEARRRLRQGWPILGVALDLGFADQSHFTRHFKRIVGVTPAVCARAH